MVQSPPRQRSPLHHWHVKRGARFIDQDGWQVPASYAGKDSEVQAARTGLGLADISAFTKISLLGRGVAGLAQTLAGDSMALKPRGVASLDAAGWLLACRLTAEHLLLLASTPDPTVFGHRLGNLLSGPGLVRSEATSAWAGFCLVGDSIEQVLRRLTSLDVSPCPKRGQAPWCEAPFGPFRQRCLTRMALAPPTNLAIRAR
jgi:hypothetical protein